MGGSPSTRTLALGGWQLALNVATSGDNGASCDLACPTAGYGRVGQDALWCDMIDASLGRLVPLLGEVRLADVADCARCRTSTLRLTDAHEALSECCGVGLRGPHEDACKRMHHHPVIRRILWWIQQKGVEVCSAHCMSRLGSRLPKLVLLFAPVLRPAALVSLPPSLPPQPSRRRPRLRYTQLSVLDTLAGLDGWAIIKEERGLSHSPQAACGLRVKSQTLATCGTSPLRCCCSCSCSCWPCPDILALPSWPYLQFLSRETQRLLSPAPCPSDSFAVDLVGARGAHSPPKTVESYHIILHYITT